MAQNQLVESSHAPVRHRRHRVKLLATPLLVLLMLLFGPILALAGSNGQVIAFGNNIGGINKLCVGGYNQYNQYRYHCFGVSGQWTLTSGWYWKYYNGTSVLLQWWNGNTQVGATGIYVPTNQSANCYYYQDRFGSTGPFYC